MKRRITYIILTICMFLIGTSECFASSISISSNTRTITKGNSVNVYVTVKTDYPMVSVEGKLQCSGVVSKSFDLNYDDSSNSLKTKTYTYSLTPSSSGTITCNVQNTRVTHLGSGNWETLATSSLSITVNNPPVVQTKPKSSNSFLSSITIDGYTLDKAFDKESLEYSTIVKEGTEKIKVNAQLADSKARVTGIGELSVTEGLNKFEIIVTAENGSKRTYILNVTVKDFEPINIKIDNETYTVVRKRKGLPEISGYFTEKNITINDNIIEGYFNETLNYEIVGLKDTKGNISYYIYNNGKYTKYNEQTFNGMVLQIIDKELIGGYKKTSFSYNNTQIESYQEVKIDILKNTYALDNNEIQGNNYYLFYAKNLETGKEELYQYDQEEKTVQRYNTLILDMYQEQSNKYYLLLLCSILALGITIITFSTIIICGSKKRKRKMRYSFEKIEEEIPVKKTIKNKKNPKSKKRIEKDLELD